MAMNFCTTPDSDRRRKSAASSLDGNITHDPTTFQFDLPGEGRPAAIELKEKWYPGARSCWPKCTSARRGDPIRQIEAIVIHATAGSSSDGAFSVMRDGRASFHWLTPDENEEAHGSHVWACAPERRAAWHVRNDCSHPEVCGGARRLNHRSLGVEIVNAQNEVDTFSEWQIQATADIVRYAWAKYPNLRHVVSHARLDPGRRSDPGSGFPWEEFKSRVLAP